MKMYYYCPSYLTFRKSQKTGTAILINQNSVKNMLKEHLPLNFVSVRFKELLAEKC